MRLRKTQTRHGCEINIAPLIDVVFLLIIFFMAISQISRVDIEKVKLPEATESDPPAKPGRLIVNVLADGQIIVSGRSNTLASLNHILASGVRESGAAELSVLIRADRQTHWEYVGRIMRACADRGISRVKVSVCEPGTVSL